MGVPCVALWAMLSTAAWAPTGAPSPAALGYGSPTAEFPPFGALNARAPCLLASTGTSMRICGDKDPLEWTPSFEPEVTTSMVATAPDLRPAWSMHFVPDAPATAHLASSSSGLTSNLWSCTLPTLVTSFDLLDPTEYLPGTAYAVGTRLDSVAPSANLTETTSFNPNWQDDDLYASFNASLGAQGPATLLPSSEPLYISDPSFSNECAVGDRSSTRLVPLSPWRSPPNAVSTATAGHQYQATRAPAWDFNRLAFEFHLMAMLHEGFKQRPLTRRQRRALASILRRARRARRRHRHDLNQGKPKAGTWVPRPSARWRPRRDPLVPCHLRRLPREQLLALRHYRRQLRRGKVAVVQSPPVAPRLDQSSLISQLCRAMWAPLTTAKLHLLYWLIVLLDGTYKPLMMCSRACAYVSWGIYKRCSLGTAHPILASAARRICYQAGRPGRRRLVPRTRSLSAVRARLGAAYQLRNIVQLA